MLVSKLFSKYFSSSEPQERVINLPIEVWFHIWSFLDFNTRQKKCTRVSKEWLHQIRNSTRLSGKMFLRLENRNVKDINDALFRWPRLKVLHLSDGCRNCKCQYGQLSKLVSDWKKMKEFASNIKLTEHELLKKIVVTKTIPFVEFGDWGKATKFWFDPKNLTPATLKNVLNLKIYDPKCFEVMQIRKRLRNLEKLYITGKSGMFDVKFDSEFISSLPTLILGFRKLTQVWISVSVDITDFFDLLHAIANIKDVKCWLNACIDHNYFGKRYVKGFFEEGFKIVEKTFPMESTTDVHIFDCRYYFRIDKNYNKEPLLNVCETSDDEEFTENEPNFSVEQFEGFENDKDSDVEDFEDYHENSNFVKKCYQLMDFLQRVSCNGFSSAIASTRRFLFLVAQILHVGVSFVLTFLFSVARILHVGVSFVHNLSLLTRTGLTIFFFLTNIFLLYLAIYIVHHLKVDVKIRGGSQTMLTKFWLLMASYLPSLTKCGHFWTTYLPCLVNVVCERPLA